jgi:hypothetical protein
LASTAHHDRPGSVPAGPSHESIVRLIRRICLLGEQGQSAEAARLETNELASALRAAREAGGAGEVAQEILAEIYTIEKERSANAVVLSELIITQLKQHLFAAGPASRPAPAMPPPADSAARQASGGSPAIPDLLDAMLAHDRSAARRRTPSSQAGSGINDNQTSHPHDNRNH